MARYYEPDEELDQYGASDWATGVGTGALTGATAGSAFGPWGTVIGGVVGAGAGAIGTYVDQQKYLAAQRQQQDLERELRSRETYDLMLQQQGLNDARARQEAVLQARQAAARGNLSAEATAMLEQQALTSLAEAQGAAKPGLFLAAQQADQARQNQVLAQYGAAQELATRATQGVGAWQQGLGTAAQGAALVGTMRGQQPTAPAAVVEQSAITQPVMFAPASPEDAAAYWRVDPTIHAGLSIPPAGASVTAPATALPSAATATPAASVPGPVAATAIPAEAFAAYPSANSGLRSGPLPAPDARPPTLTPLPSTVQAAARGDADELVDLTELDQAFIQAYGSSNSLYSPAPAGVDQTDWTAWATEMNSKYGIEPQYLTKEFYMRWRAGEYGQARGGTR